MSAWSIIVAAGTSQRFGAPKQFAMVGDAAVLVRSVATAARCSDGVVVVAASDCLDQTAQLLADTHGFSATHLLSGNGVGIPCVLHLVAGGATRSESVRNGLAVVPADASVIVVHDAARPLATPGLFAAVIASVHEGADAAVPGIPVVDTIRNVSGGVVDRSELVAVQTPQAFNAAALRAAHAAASEATDDAGLVESAGGTVVVVPGETSNLKITTPTDLEIVRALALLGDTDATKDQP